MNSAVSLSTLEAAAIAQPSVAARPARRRDAVEIAAAFGMLEIALWTPKAAQLRWGIAMLAVVALLTVFGRRTATDLGLGALGFRGALVLLPISAGVCALLLVTGWLAGWLHSPISSVAVKHGLGYVAWAFAQQYMAQSFYYVRFESLVGSRRAMWIAAALFSVAHLPNPVLLPATFFAGLAFTYAFRRYRNLYPIAAAHAMLGLALSVALPMSWTHQMRVGLGYLLLHH